MARHLIVVEGAHDAAFFGQLLRRRNFQRIELIADVPEFWKALIPTRYPTNNHGRLDRIIVFPDFYSHKNGDTFAVSVAGSDSQLLENLKIPIDLKGLPDFDSLSIALDTDWKHSEQDRFARLIQSLSTWNVESLKDRRVGFPIQLPDAPNTVATGSPRFGIYQFPGAGHQGALETVLLECASTAYPLVHSAAEAMLLEVDNGHAAGDEIVTLLRTRSGRSKAHCGLIANVLKPGSSLAVSLRQTSWIPQDLKAVQPAHEIALFLDKLLGLHNIMA